MTDRNPKCIIILSTKSSGSSALQNFLTSQMNVNRVKKTRHGENETLFWVKAASVLGLPQTDMYDSEVPIPAKNAREDLIRLLQDNLTSTYEPPSNNEDLIFGGWRLLCKEFGPIFLEKSPHHLHQHSALQLISKFIKENPDIEFFIIGLVRNPMDTVYSMWKRWRGLPEKNQSEWYTAYRNLMQFRESFPGRMIVIRYEDMVQNLVDFDDLYQFTEITTYNKDFFHKGSLGKWKKDKSFGFQLSDKVIELGQQFGYQNIDMLNNNTWSWPIYRNISFYFNKSIQYSNKFLRGIKKRLSGINKFIFCIFQFF